VVTAIPLGLGPAVAVDRHHAEDRLLHVVSGDAGGRPCDVTAQHTFDDLVTGRVPRAFGTCRQSGQTVLAATWTAANRLLAVLSQRVAIARAFAWRGSSRHPIRGAAGHIRDSPDPPMPGRDALRTVVRWLEITADRDRPAGLDAAAGPAGSAGRGTAA
jgi:hypothetical protein